MFSQQPDSKSNSGNSPNSPNNQPSLMFTANNNQARPLFAATPNNNPLQGSSSIKNSSSPFECSQSAISKISSSPGVPPENFMNFLAQPSSVQTSQKAPQTKPKQNPAFNFFPLKDSQEQQVEKKQEIPRQFSLVGSSFGPAPLKSEPTQANKNIPVPSLFWQNPEATALFSFNTKKKEEKSNQPPGLFTSQQPPVLGSEPMQGPAEKGASQKNPINLGSINSFSGNFSGNTANPVNLESVSANKASENKPVVASQSFFGGIGGFTVNNSSNAQPFFASTNQNNTSQGFAFFNNQPTNPKQVTVKAPEPKPTLFDNQPKQPSSADNKASRPLQHTPSQNLADNTPQVPKPVKKIQSNTADQIKVPTSLQSPSQIPTFKKTGLKIIEANPAPSFSGSLFKKTEEVQKPEQPKATTSLFAQTKKDEERGPLSFGAFNNQQNKPGQTSDTPTMSNKVTQNVSTNLPANTQVTNFSIDANKKLLPQTQKARTERPAANASNLLQSEMWSEQNQGNVPKLNMKTTAEKPNQPQFKPAAIATPPFVDFKTLKKLQGSENFDLFLTQKRQDIINSIKVYFSWRQSEEKLKEVESNASEKDKFYTNLTNLFIKLARVESKHYAVCERYVRSVLADENYEVKLFVGNSFNTAFMMSNLIYVTDFEGKLRLNEQGSIELNNIVNIVFTRWSIEKINYLNFLFQHQELIKPQEDLFTFLFTHLVRLELNEQDPNALIIYQGMEDFTKLVSSKLAELLDFYNKKVGKNYNKLLTEQPQKVIIGLLPSIERLKNPTSICLVLRVILNSINLNQWEKIDKNLIKAVKETKSNVFLPLRAILSRLKQQEVQFIAYPKDLFRYVSGDEWVDWIELYLSSGNGTVSRQEIECLMESLSKLSSKLLLDRLTTARKGIYKFFQLLREQNLVEHYYRVMELCLTDEQSIKQIEQFYFKQTSFSYEYSEIKDYVLSFHENMSKPALETAAQQSVINILFPKISLLTRIIEIEPEKLFQLDVLIFDPETKLRRLNQQTDIDLQSVRGHKLLHLLVDIVNIVSVKWLQTKILARIFKVLQILLRNKKTEALLIAVTNINKPSFRFIEKNQLAKETEQEVSWLLYHTVRSTYLEDLIINSSQVSENSTGMQMFYTLRYNSAEYCDLMSSEQIPRDFSIYWINQLFITASKQKFNPTILNELLTKLHIIPSQYRDEPEPVEHGIRRYRRSQWKIPKLFEMIVNLTNSFSIWQQVNKILEYQIVREGVEWKLINTFNPSNTSKSHQAYIFSCLRLMRTVFTLNQMLMKCQLSNPNHFITRTLSSLTILNKIETSTKMSLNNRNNILTSLLALIKPGQFLQNDTYRIKQWQVEQQQPDSSKTQPIFEYIKKNQLFIDFSQAINFARSPDNMYYDCIQNVSSLSLECIIHFLRLSTDSSFQVCMLKGTETEYQEKLRLRTELMKKFSNTFIRYFSQEEFINIRYRFLQFIYDLKYNLGKNKLNEGLADSLFADFLKVHKVIDSDVRLNHLILLYLLKDLSQNKDKFEYYLEPTVLGVIKAFQLRESHLQGNAVIRNTSQIGSILLRYFHKEYSLLSLNQMQRIIDQRAIIEIGQQLQTLNHAVQILTKLLCKKNYSNSLSLALIALNRLIAQKNLILLINDVPFEYFSLPNNELLQFQERYKRPRQFLRDPLQMFLSQNKSLQQKREIQETQKNNIIQWFIQISQRLTEKLTTYLLFALTINKTFYANNPIEFNVVRPDLANKDIFCHLSLGTTALTAVQIFGKSEADAVEIVQVISENIISRLVILQQTLKQIIVRDSHDAKNYLQGLKMLGFSLQWLRNKRKGDQFGANDVVRKINRNYQFLLPNGQSNFHKEQLKLIQSYLSIGEPIQNHIKYDIQHYLYLLINSYHNSLDSLQNQNNNQELGLLAQQAFAIMLISPPACNEQAILRQLVSIWSKQKNQSFFFNQSRLILELASLYPEQMAKLKILSQYQLYSGLRPTKERYQQGARSVDSMKWIWALHIVTALLTSSDSVLVIDEVSSFVIKNKTKLYKTLQGDQKKITRAYAQQLEVTLNLISILLTNSLWISKNSNILEEVTYIMSHNLSKYFVGIAQGKIFSSPESTNQKILSQLRVSTVHEESEMVQEQAADQYQSIFGLQIKIKTIYCLRFYLIAMEIALFKSHYIQKHFNNNVLGTSRYLSSFWDTFSRELGVLFNYTINKTYDWLKIKKTKQLFQMMNNCYHAPHTFIQNGFLTSIIELPQTDSEIFSDLYLLCFLVTKLAVTHFIRMRTYINRFNAMITTLNETFGARIKEHITRVGELNKKLPPNCHLFVTSQNFKKQAEIIDSRTTLK